MVNKFSLIMATYGRCIEVNNFLESILNSNYSKELVEVIIVDQNDKIDLNPIIERYNKILNIIHIKSDKKGLSLNRNIGLKKATGDILAFPDDDCEYLTNTLKEIDDYFNSNDCDLIMGRIVERDDSDSLRKWPKKYININKRNFYTKSSSVTIFFRSSTCKVGFNNVLGAGAKYGACEDADLIYKTIKDNKKVVYNPNIKIYHPHYDSSHNMSNEKIFSYGLGFGAMIKSNFDFNMAILFIRAQAYHFFKMIKGLILLNKDNITRSYLALKSRFTGVLEFKENY